MGMGGGSGGPNAVKSEINVTPLVDIVLVLLIIFLVTMPVLMRTVTLEVPRKAEEQEDTSVAAKSIVLTQRADLSINLSDSIKDDRIVNPEQIAKELRPVLDQKQGEKIVFVDFCEGVPWASVVKTMDDVRSIAKDDNHNEIKVALKKKEAKSKIDPTKTDPCALK